MKHPIYDTDERGYYDRREYQRTGRKLRPLAFEDGELIIDCPEASAIRAWWRGAKARSTA